MAKKSVTYKNAGVDIVAGDRFVQLLKPLAQRTFTAGVRGDIGGFAALFAPDLAAYQRPLLVSATDGVGTKLKVATLMGRYNTVGIDLVAMCVNDIVVTGATPLFFLDYFATARLDVAQGVEVIDGITQGCLQAGCALIGGETAELPGFYPAGDFELAGFAVGVVDETKVVDGAAISPGDAIIGLASQGLHSNGYSLARRVLLDALHLGIHDTVAGLATSLGEELLRPTRIYVKTILALLRTFTIKGMAHVTGGGIAGNVIRILPPGSKAVIVKERWQIPPIFHLIAKRGNVPDEEMWKTFNNGIGLVLVVAAADTAAIVQAIETMGDKAFIIGEVVAGEGVELV